MNELATVTPLRSEVVESWDEMVRQGREAAASQWRLGDLAISVETTYGEDRIGEYATAIGVAARTLREYRQMATTYPAENGARAPYSVARAFRNEDDRLALLEQRDWTVKEARALVKQRNTPELPPPPDDEEDGIDDGTGCRVTDPLIHLTGVLDRLESFGTDWLSQPTIPQKPKDRRYVKDACRKRIEILQQIIANIEQYEEEGQ